MDDDADPATELSRRLAEEQRRLASLRDEAVKAELSRRLIAVTNVAKHDVATALRRLDALSADLAAAAETSES